MSLVLTMLQFLHPSEIPGHGARVQCLQHHVDSADMSEGCRTEVKKDVERAAQGA